jgi:serine/threonine protein kinase
MGIPRIIRRVEAAKRDDKRGSNRVSSGIAKAPKKKRADKLRALAGAFNAEAQKDEPVDPLELKYEVHEKIGQGKQGVAVFRCTLRSTGQVFAVKRVPRTQQLGHAYANEWAIMQTLQGSSQLVQVLDVIEGPKTVNFIMELASGGDFFEWIATHGALCEDRARPLFSGLLGALQQVHSKGLIHRDIKLENILLMNEDPTAPDHVHLADFEHCCASPSNGAVGSIAYAAPETLADESYTPAVDVWAAGVALYGMLSASSPFDCPGDPTATAQRIRAGVHFEEDCWVQISPAAKDLLTGLLHPDPACRLDLTTARMHPWLTGLSNMPAPISSNKRHAEPMSVESAHKSPKFALRCTWHTKTKRWSQKGLAGPAGVGEVRMLMDEDEDASPLVACPLEWCPSSTPRGRANSL